VRHLDFRFSRSSERDIVQILETTSAKFGLAASRRYQSLIGQAVRDLAENPNRVGAQAEGARIHYHLRHSRTRVAGARVSAPRHYLVVRIDGSMMTILAIVYDGMVESLARRIAAGERSSD